MEPLERRLLLSATRPFEPEMRLIDESLVDYSATQTAVAGPEIAGLEGYSDIFADTADGLVIAPDDTLSGNRTIVADVVNRGVLSPGNSPGTINITGDLTIDGSDGDVVDDNYTTPGVTDTVGTLKIELGGTTAGTGYDQINVDGNITLGGTLDIDLINSFSPSGNDTFDILTYTGSLTGTFDTASGLFGFGDGSLYFDIVDTGSALQLKVEEAPGFVSSTPAINEVLGQFYNIDHIGSISSGPIDGELTIDQFVNVQGTFSFGVSTKQDVTVATGLPSSALTALSLPAATLSNVDMLALDIGASDVHAFVGVNGPYWTDDLNNDGVVDANEVNSDALGLVVNNLDIGFTLMKPDPTDTDAHALALNAAHPRATFYALKATADTIEFVGWDEVDVSADNLTINVNNGVAWTGGLGPPGRLRHRPGRDHPTA